jgi:protein-L-isoaspartate(D-aspartate) O-methyltransferase
MVVHLRRLGITDDAVLEAMQRVRRHRFIPGPFRGAGDYGDHPCPIGHGQTISQPYIVAYMTQQIRVRPGMKILEVGTGSGYQAAVLATLGAEVWSIEILPALAAHARAALDAEQFEGVHTRTGDGHAGWPEAAPFDAVIVTCAPTEIPPELVRQLREGGRMILPIGFPQNQQLITLSKESGRMKPEDNIAVRFVPMVRGED